MLDMWYTLNQTNKKCKILQNLYEIEVETWKKIGTGGYEKMFKTPDQIVRLERLRKFTIINVFIGYVIMLGLFCMIRFS